MSRSETSLTVSCKTKSLSIIVNNLVLDLDIFEENQEEINQ